MKSLIQNTFAAKSPIHGWGGFAKKPIRKGETIEECPIIESTAEKNHPEEMKRYLFDGQKRNMTMIFLGYGCVYNHSHQSNAEYFYDDEKNTIIFVAKRKINKGEEVFIDYGRTYWSSRKRKPR